MLLICSTIANGQSVIYKLYATLDLAYICIFSSWHTPLALRDGSSISGDRNVEDKMWSEKKIWIGGIKKNLGPKVKQIVWACAIVRDSNQCYSWSLATSYDAFIDPTQEVRSYLYAPVQQSVSSSTNSTPWFVLIMFL